MDRTVSHTSSVAPERVVEVLSDLGTYPDWFTVVAAAEPAPATSGDPGPAWFVTLRAAIGPISRTKRLRMVRTELTDQRIRFARSEVDARSHSEWELDVTVVGAGSGGSDVAVTLSYRGGLFEPVVGRVLDSEIENSRPQLEAVLTA